MASRSLVDQRRKTMEEALRLACQRGTLAPGDPLPALRTLAEQYGLSRQIAWKAIQNLTAEGLFTTTARMGTFVSKPRHDVKLFLLAAPHEISGAVYLHQIQCGFEERVSQLGGTSLSMTDEEAKALYEAGQLPPLSGIYRPNHHVELDGSRCWWPEVVPSVSFGPAEGAPDNMDSVAFDDKGGGRLATQHLLAMGHTRVAYLAMHSDEGHPERFFWSMEREAGWRDAMSASGHSNSDLAFHIQVDSTLGDAWGREGHHQFAAAYQIARHEILPREDITAVVAANVTAAEGLFAALQESGRPIEDLPAVLCFDNSTPKATGVLSYMRLPWDEVGRQAANLLWSRANGNFAGPSRNQLVPMQVIQRLSCRPRNLNVMTAPLLLSAAGPVSIPTR